MLGRGVARLGLAVLVAAGAACTEKDEGSVAELCAAVGDGSAFVTTFEGFDPTDSERALDQLRTARVDLGELQDVAPSEVRDDLTIEIDFVQAMLDGLEAADPDDPSAAVAAIQRASADHPDVAEASGRLAAWAADSC